MPTKSKHTKGIYMLEKDIKKPQSIGSKSKCFIKHWKPKQTNKDYFSKSKAYKHLMLEVVEIGKHAIKNLNAYL